MKALKVLLAVVIFANVALFGYAAGGLEDLRSKYQTAEKKIEQGRKSLDAQAGAAYAKMLKVHMEQLKNKGDLDGYIATEKALGEYTASGAVPVSDETISLHVRQVAAGYEKAIAQAAKWETAARLRLLRQYRHALKEHVKGLMQANKISDAKIAKSELDKVAFMVADLEFRQPKPEPAKKASEPKVKSNSEPRRLLPSDARAYGDHHYKIFKASEISWSEAGAKCKEMGGHLATADSEEELEFIRQYKGRTVLWLGGNPGQAMADTGKLHKRQDSGFKRGAGSKYIHHYICEWDH